jgi:hypothetical protein
MNDYFISRYTEGRLRELRAEAARERLARSRLVRRGPRRRLARGFFDRRRAGGRTVASPCCA